MQRANIVSAAKCISLGAVLTKCKVLLIPADVLEAAAGLESDLVPRVGVSASSLLSSLLTRLDLFLFPVDGCCAVSQL